MNTRYKSLLTLLTGVVFLGFAVAETQAQDADDGTRSRFSIGLMGGVTKGHMNIGTELDPTFGANIRYAASPVFAFQLNALFGEFTSTDDDGVDGNGNFFNRHFDNSYITTSLTTQFNILRILGANSETINWYGSAGGGLIFNDVTTSQDANTPQAQRGVDHSETAFFATFGTGLRLNLGRRIDLFAQYDFNIPNSDLIDGFQSVSLQDGDRIDLHRRTPDPWSTITGGIQIKFGSHADADWKAVPPPVTQDQFAGLERRVDDLEGRVDDNSARIDALDQKVEDYNDAVNQRIDDLEQQLRDLDERLREVERVELTFDGDILFDFDSAVIRSDARPTLARLASVLAKHPDRTVHIIGHTCNIGTEEYNQGLSERRAASVEEYLLTTGILENGITTEGRGLTEPLVSNETEEGRRLNRRVHIIIDRD